MEYSRLLKKTEILKVVDFEIAENIGNSYHIEDSNCTCSLRSLYIPVGFGLEASSQQAFVKVGDLS